MPKDGVVALFPGQGDVHMGKDGWHRHPIVQEIFRDASDIAGRPIPAPSDLAPESPQVERQLSLMAASLGRWEMIRQEGVSIVAAGGISLGEYAAAVATGALSRADGFRAVWARGRCMDRYARAGDMLAVLGLDTDNLRQALQDVTADAYIACIYGPRHHLVSGTDSALPQVRLRLSQPGIRVVTVPTGIPSHCPLMAAVVPCLYRAFKALDWRPLSIPWLSGVDGQATRRVVTVRERLVRQTVEPVHWLHIVHTLRYVHNRVMDIGPGQSVSRLLKNQPGLALIPYRERIMP
ncbi:MAG: ACP S-malonyltransferase [Sulfobacillus sp.]|nr:ACP S-malonyltransferase [Sulfobacillus sp.]